MPRRNISRIPSYRLHKSTGLAVVRLNGRDVYLGRHGSEESRAEYQRVIAEWLANGRHAPPPNGVDHGHYAPCNLTINDLFLRYWQEHVCEYYIKDGKPTNEQANIRQVMAILCETHGHTLASSFGPLALKAFRGRLLEKDLARRTINRDVDRVKRMFRWAGENEIVSPQFYENLRCVPGLKRGRCRARESEPVTPAPEDQVEAVLARVSEQAKRVADHQLPFWTERMVVAYLSRDPASGSTVSKDDGKYALRWPDGAEQDGVAFDRFEAEATGATVLTVEDRRIRALLARLPQRAPNTPCARVSINGVSDKVAGWWSLWRISAAAPAPWSRIFRITSPNASLKVVRSRMGWGDECLHRERIETSPGPGNAFMFEVESVNIAEVFTSFGIQGVPAEAVADRAVDELRRYLAADVPVGDHLADQLLLPMTLAAMQARRSRFRTLPLSRHATTQIGLIRRFVDVPIAIDHPADRETVVTVG